MDGGGADDRGVSCRCRLLDINDTGLWLERPSVAYLDLMRPGTAVTIMAASDDACWILFTQVTDTPLHQLNASVRVPALKVGFPDHVRAGQRRDFFRVSAAGAGIDGVLLIPVLDDEQGTAPADEDRPQAFHASLLNVSGGGLGLSVPPRAVRQIDKFDRYLCRLMLPNLAQPLNIPVRVVRHAEQRSGSVYLGLCFELQEKHPEHVRIVDVLCRFAAYLQRERARMLRQKT